MYIVPYIRHQLREVQQFDYHRKIAPLLTTIVSLENLAVKTLAKP